jgi:hypothetical protein
LVGDSSINIMEGTEEIAEGVAVEVDREIASIAYNHNYVALILKNEKKTEQSLYIYNKSGKIVSEANIEKSYEHIELYDNQILLYEGTACEVYDVNGTQKFKGELPKATKKIFPIGGVNKYMSVTDDGMDEIRFTK